MKRKPEDHSPAAVVPAGTPGRPWWGCYVGEATYPPKAKRGVVPVAPLYAGPETAVLVIGPPRSGKTSSLIIPSVLDAPGAMVSTSTKGDVLAATALHRSRFGRSYLFDPAGTTELPWWMHELRWSPVVGCESFDRAASMAHALASAARPGASLTESAHWVERAETLLTPLLFAAATRGLDMATVFRWVVARDLREPQAVIADSGHELAAAILAGIATTDERERSGIFSTASGLLAGYRSERVLNAASRPNFDPVAFSESADSLYICAPAQKQDQLAPLVVALLEQIRAATLGRPSFAAPVVFALDEVANIAPLPSLPSLAAEGGGQGLITLACLQDLSQARVRWGEAADGFFTLFGTKIVLSGVADHRTLSLISALAGEKVVQVPSFTSSGFIGALLSDGKPTHSVTKSFVWRPRMPIDIISQGRAGHALLINGSVMSEVRIPPWWQHSYWEQLVRPKDVTPESLRRYAPA